MNIVVDEVREVTEDLLEAFRRLVPQLTRNSPPPSRESLEAILAEGVCAIFVARDTEAGGRIVGTLTLALFRIPTAVRAWIEDVVVDEACRGRGVGEALTRAAFARARKAGAKRVELTSGPDRLAAHRLYERLGFRRRESHLYRCEPLPEN